MARNHSSVKKVKGGWAIGSSPSARVYKSKIKAQSDARRIEQGRQAIRRARG